MIPYPQLGADHYDQTVDTVGAGDSFNAGFLHKFMLRANLEDCLSYWNAVSALSTTRAGGTEAFRDQHHRETFLQKASVRRDNSRASQW